MLALGPRLKMPWRAHVVRARQLLSARRTFPGPLAAFEAHRTNSGRLELKVLGLRMLGRLVMTLLYYML